MYFGQNGDKVLNSNYTNYIPLFDVDNKLIAYFLLMPNNKYCIVDARKNGYGVLESGNNNGEFLKFKQMNSSGRLFYIFPSIIVRRRDLKMHIKNSHNRQKSLKLTFPSNRISDYNWHWMTKLKYFRNTINGDRYIAVSTWGKRRSLNFNALWDGNCACGVLYFK